MPAICSPLNPDPQALAGFVGLDVAKASVTIFDGTTRRCWSVPNTPASLRKTLQALGERILLVCEATGGLERTLLDAAFALGMPIHRADAARTSAFMASHGAHAKTDPEDARWLAQYGAERHARLSRWTPPDAQRQHLAELVRARRDLLEERVRLRNRIAAPGGASVKALLRRHDAHLSALIEEIDAAMSELIATSQSLQRAEAALRSQKGTGKIVARTLLGLLPELGQLDQKRIASLAGLAPHPRQSGQSKQHQRMCGGRDGIRPTLFMAALSAARRHPTLSVFHQRLLAAGKPKRLALAAVARKIVVIANALIRDANKNANQLT